jgi:hypothetical protein
MTKKNKVDDLFWSNVRKAHEIMSECNHTIKINIFDVNAYYGYPYGKSIRGMKKLIKKLRKQGVL